jgi:hypothetical protein
MSIARLLNPKGDMDHVDLKPPPCSRVLELSFSKKKLWEVTVEFKNLSSEAAELRSIMLASSMTSCYLIMERMSAQRDTSLHYEDFRSEWIELFKHVHKAVSRMRPRNDPR